VYIVDENEFHLNFLRILNDLNSKPAVQMRTSNSATNGFSYNPATNDFSCESAIGNFDHLFGLRPNYKQLSDCPEI